MIIGIFGKPGSGKSTLMGKYLADALLYQQLAMKKHWYLPFMSWWYTRKAPSVIFSTEPMPGTVQIKSYDLGLFEPPDNALFLIHEAGCDFNNRLISKIPQYVGDFAAQHRHYKSTIIYDSQTVDIDKRIRNRTSHYYVVTKNPIFRNFSKIVKVKYWIGVNNEAKALDECYSEPDSILAYLAAVLTKQIRSFYRPKYYKYFDSYSKKLKFKYSFAVDPDKNIPSFIPFISRNSDASNYDGFTALPIASNQILDNKVKYIALPYIPTPAMRWKIIVNCIWYDFKFLLINSLFLSLIIIIILFLVRLFNG